ncbi:MAG TPA: hypothetical protein VGE11_02970, partial [Pseudonocardia sp.]
LRLLERVTGVLEPNISAWRRQTFGDLTSVFRFGDAAVEAPTLPSPHNAAVEAWAKLPTPRMPGMAQVRPTQEPGTRPRTEHPRPEHTFDIW